MNQTFQNSAQVLSIGIFFTLMIVGLSATLPRRMSSGLRGARRAGRGRPTASPALPPVSILFAAFLGYNPIQHLVGAHTLAALPAHAHATLAGRGFFPHLISGPFRDRAATSAFTFAIVACLVAAAASLMRGGRYHHAEEPAAVPSASRERSRTGGAACKLSGTASRRSP